MLIVTGILLGINHLIYNYNIQTILTHIPGILFPLILLFPLYKIGALGAGDLKLFSLLGFYFTFFETAFCMFLSFGIGAVISIIVLLWRRNTKERMLHFWNYIKKCIWEGHICYYYPQPSVQRAFIQSTEEEKSKIHFSLPIFIGVIFMQYGNRLF